MKFCKITNFQTLIIMLDKLQNKNILFFFLPDESNCFTYQFRFKLKRENNILINFSSFFSQPQSASSIFVEIQIWTVLTIQILYLIAVADRNNQVTLVDAS